jgi:large subunit ribosomal protein L25
MNVELLAESRSKYGKGAARRLRREDKVPGIVYGPKAQPLPVAVAANALERLLKEMGKESKLLQLTVEDGNDRQLRQVLIREVQVHPVRRRFLHIDFYEVPLDHPIVVEVPIELLGEPVGVKQGGMLNLVRRTLAVRCLPAEIPDRVSIDVTALGVGAAVHVADLVSNYSFELVDDAHMTVVTINAPEGLTEAAEGEESRSGEEVTGK